MVNEKWYRSQFVAKLRFCYKILRCLNFCAEVGFHSNQNYNSSCSSKVKLFFKDIVFTLITFFYHKTFKRSVDTQEFDTFPIKLLRVIWLFCNLIFLQVLYMKMKYNYERVKYELIFLQYVINPSSSEIWYEIEIIFKWLKLHLSYSWLVEICTKTKI